jgi:hypothetical protein
MIVTVKTEGLDRLANMLAAAGPKARDAIRRALNHSGMKARTQMIRALTAQTGLKRAVIVRALKVSRAVHGGDMASPGSGGLTFAIRSAGGNIRLKFFGARETRAGVSAAPRGQRRTYPGAFIKGGRFPRRVPLKLGGNVFRRIGPGRRPIAQIRSGVFIPEEMVEGASRDAFLGTVESSLPARLSHELLRILG